MDKCLLDESDPDTTSPVATARAHLIERKIVSVGRGGRWCTSVGRSRGRDVTEAETRHRRGSEGTAKTCIEEYVSPIPRREASASANSLSGLRKEA